MWKGQNQEDRVISEWFGDFKGKLLSIGENDGVTISNTHELIRNGWLGCLVEPSPIAFSKLKELYRDNHNVSLFNCAVGDDNRDAILYDSGELLGRGDAALVSTCKKQELERWKPINMPFVEKEVQMLTFEKLLMLCPYKEFDFINVDAEGYDMEIILQMDLAKLNCKCICAEHNSNHNVTAAIREHCRQFGLTKIICLNAENIILVHE